MTDAADQAVAQPQPRVGARVILLDPDGRVLLIHERIEGGTHWLTPGGGVDADEPLPVAAMRELHEETGLRIVLDADSQPVHTTLRRWHWRGKSWQQTDYFFVARLLELTPLAPAALTDMEQETLLEMRWWTIAELRAAPASVDGADFVLEPADLADLVDGLPLSPRVI